MRRVAAVSLVLLGLAPARAGAAVPLSPCPSVAQGAACGTVAAPLDHTGATPGTQPVGFSLLPATGTRTGTLAVLVGGPGQAGSAVAKSLAAALAPVRSSYALLIVDQRGTGRSGGMSCPSLASATSLRAVTTCGQSLGAARAFLTTREDAYDLESVRAALGVPKLSIYAVSYGTGIAGYYARLFSDRVDRMVLDSPQPIEGPDALETLRQLALPRVLREVCWPPSCRGYLADNPITGVATLAARLRTAPLRGKVVTPAGRRVGARLTSTGLYALTAVSDLDPFLRTRMPSAIAAALRGDAAPVLRLAVGLPASDVAGREFSAARLLATACVDSRLPWDPAAPATTKAAALKQAVTSRPASAWAPFSPTAVLSFSEAAICLGWPSTPKPQGVPQQGPAGVPVLVVSGRDDLRTPLEDARRTAAQYPNAQVLAVPDTGHSVLSSDPTSCTITGIADFLSGAAATKCAREERQPDVFPYVPANVGNLRRVPGLPAAEGRTATALGATLLDAIRQAARLAEAGERRVGGLRAGTLTLAGTHVTLRNYSLVNGVALTGTVPLTRAGTGHLTVTAATPGRFTLRAGRLTGTLGTDKVRLAVKLPLV